MPERPEFTPFRRRITQKSAFLRVPGRIVSDLGNGAFQASDVAPGLYIGPLFWQSYRAPFRVASLVC